MNIILDTNVLVSALWSRSGNAAQIVDKLLNKKFSLCYTREIFLEYQTVLFRPKLSFDQKEVAGLLRHISAGGLLLDVAPSSISLPDESDRKFYDAARACSAFLITGNKKHFPKESFIISPAEFLLR
jgi:putative PIN family toxin of toxin-antitoxin system